MHSGRILVLLPCGHTANASTTTLSHFLVPLPRAPPVIAEETATPAVAVAAATAAVAAKLAAAAVADLEQGQTCLHGCPVPSSSERFSLFSQRKVRGTQLPGNCLGQGAQYIEVEQALQGVGPGAQEEIEALGKEAKQGGPKGVEV